MIQEEPILLVTEFAKQRQLEAVNTETLDKVKGHKLKQIRYNCLFAGAGRAKGIVQERWDSLAHGVCIELVLHGV